MAEDKDYKELLDDMRNKNLKLQQEVDVWKNQWKGFQAHKESHWTIDVPKPRLTVGNSWSNVISWIMSQEPEKLYKTYIVVCIVCMLVSTLMDIYKKAREW